VREQKYEEKAVSFTRDTQRVDIAFALTLYPDPIHIHSLYRQFGADWQQKLIPQTAQDAIKNVVGQYIADDLVGKRDEARNKAQAEVQKNLAINHVIATRLDFTNLDFDDNYEKAVEDKVVAVQKAAEAKNKTVEVEEKARQTVLEAEADAKAMLIKSNALKENKSLVEFNAVEKWDGKLPQYMMGNTVPFIKLEGK
jgi:regulator of protease activity HflC (stomatin/prohibitin superfamily)